MTNKEKDMIYINKLKEALKLLKEVENALLKNAGCLQDI